MYLTIEDFRLFYDRDRIRQDDTQILAQLEAAEEEILNPLRPFIPVGVYFIGFTYLGKRMVSELAARHLTFGAGLAGSEAEQAELENILKNVLAEVEKYRLRREVPAWALFSTPQEGEPSIAERQTPFMVPAYGRLKLRV